MAAMTVQDLIDELNEIKDKTKEIRISFESGRGDQTPSTEDVFVVEDDDFVFINGEEDPEFCP